MSKDHFGERAWEMYRAAFSEGDEVVVIDELERFYWGKLETQGDFGCTLHPLQGKPVSLAWDMVIFMAHDGFPIRKLRGADGSVLVEKIDTSDTTEAIRRALTKDICCECNRLKSERKMHYHSPRKVICSKCKTAVAEAAAIAKDLAERKAASKARRSSMFYFGDPWELGAASARIVNPGNSGEDHWCEDDEEALVLTTDQGAVAHLFNLPLVFHVQAVA